MIFDALLLANGEVLEDWLYGYRVTLLERLVKCDRRHCRKARNRWRVKGGGFERRIGRTPRTVQEALRETFYTLLPSLLSCYFPFFFVRIGSITIYSAGRIVIINLSIPNAPFFRRGRRSSFHSSSPSLVSGFCDREQLKHFFWMI